MANKSENLDGKITRYRFGCIHDTYNDSKLEYERWYQESEENAERIANRLREKIPYIVGVVVSVSVHSNEIMIDTSEKLTDSDMEYLCKPSTLGGYQVVCTSAYKG